jgi:hypothetical protein
MRGQTVASLLILGILPGALVVLLAIPYAQERAASTRAKTPLDSLLRRLPTHDLALGAASRASRSPSTEEPSAAMADAPGGPDADPALGFFGVVSPALFMDPR